MKKKYFIIAPIILVLIVALAIYFTRTSQTTVTEGDIKVFMNTYFEEQYNILANLSDEIDISDYYMLNNEISVKSHDYNKLVLRSHVSHRKAQSTDLTFNKYTFNLDFIEIDIDNSTIHVKLLENNDIYFNVTPHISSSMVGKVHLIDILYSKNKMYILEHRYEDDMTIKIDNLLAEGYLFSEIVNMFSIPEKK